MLLEEFDADKYERSLKEEGREKGETQLLRLLEHLFSDNRPEDIRLAVNDSGILLTAAPSDTWQTLAMIRTESSKNIIILFREM